MDIPNTNVSLHPQLLELLFAHKSKTRAVFQDVLALHEIHHLSLTYINQHHELLCLSSTPAIEYNLFSSPLWRFDRTYSPDWYKQCRQAYWPSLYEPSRYDELYYLKQIKPHYPLGLSLAARLGQGHVIYSVASTNDDEHTRALFETEQAQFYKLGQYCTTHLLPFLLPHEDAFASLFQPVAAS